ncbi:MAG: hypothetical protein ACRDZZ_00400 [Ilumatobacteraceae bacterium]
MTDNPLTCKWCGSLRVRRGDEGAAAVCKHCDAPCGKGPRCEKCNEVAVRS